MGSYLYDFLENSFLGKEKYYKNNYSSFTTTEILKELESYRHFTLKRCTEVKDAFQTPACISGVLSNNITIDEITKLALYHDKVIKEDPLFRYTSFISNKYQHLIRRCSLSEKKSKLEKKELAKTVIQLNQLRPFSSDNFLHYYPSTTIKDQLIPFYIDPLKNKALMPDKIIDFLYKEAVVTKIRPIGGGYIKILPDEELSRDILISFQGHSEKMGYHLSSGEFLPQNKFVFRSDSVKPDIETFCHWVYQSIFSTGQEYLQRVDRLFNICHMTNSPPITNSAFDQKTFSLLSTFGQSQHDTSSSNLILNIDLPVINQISPENIMFLRKEYTDAFHIFREELKKKIAPIIAEPDPLKAKGLFKAVQEELFETNPAQFEAKTKILKSASLKKDLELSTTIFATNFIAGHSVTQSAALAMCPCLCRFFQDKKAQQANTAFFTWKLKKYSK